MALEVVIEMVRARVRRKRVPLVRVLIFMVD